MAGTRRVERRAVRKPNRRRDNAHRTFRIADATHALCEKGLRKPKRHSSRHLCQHHRWRICRRWTSRQQLDGRAICGGVFSKMTPLRRRRIPSSWRLMHPRQIGMTRFLDQNNRGGSTYAVLVNHLKHSIVFKFLVGFSRILVETRRRSICLELHTYRHTLIEVESGVGVEIIDHSLLTTVN